MVPITAVTGFVFRVRSFGAHYKPVQMATFAERFTEQGRQEGMQQGEAAVLLCRMECKFKDVPEEVRQRVKKADPQTLFGMVRTHPHRGHHRGGVEAEG
jgi:hypothetical protein